MKLFEIQGKAKENHYFNDIEKETINNKNYRKVLFTSDNMQLVAMSLKPKEEIGMETHENGAQFIRIEQGEAKFIIEGQTHNAKNDDAIIIPQGKKHNVINTSDTDDLKLYAIYAPPEHEEGTVQKNKN